MTQGERIKILRKELKLSQEKFGAKLGLSKVAISDIEKGVGEIFTEIKKESPLDMLSEDYDINEIDKLIILRYLQLSKEDRKSINNFILGVYDK